MTAEEFAALFAAVRSWGRWGPHDERGALNHLTPGRVAAAAALVRDGLTVSLSLPMNTAAALDNPEPAMHHTVYLIGDGILRTSRKKAAPPEQEEALKTLFRQGDYVGAHNYCKTNPSPLTNVLRSGIGLLGEGKQVAEEGMTGALAKENSQMQTYISYLTETALT